MMPLRSSSNCLCPPSLTQRCLVQRRCRLVCPQYQKVGWLWQHLAAAQQRGVEVAVEGSIQCTATSMVNNQGVGGNMSSNPAGLGLP